MQNLAYWFLFFAVAVAGFFSVVSLRAEQIRFKVKLNQRVALSHIHGRMQFLPFLETKMNARMVVCRTYNVHLRSFQTDKMVQNAPYQTMNCCHFCWKKKLLLLVPHTLFIAIATKVDSVPTTSNMVNMGFGFFSVSPASRLLFFL